MTDFNKECMERFSSIERRLAGIETKQGKIEVGQKYMAEDIKEHSETLNEITRSVNVNTTTIKNVGSIIVFIIGAVGVLMSLLGYFLPN